MSDLLQKLRERINTEGAISVAGYMELCNAHYYATRDPFGAKGDFTTAPEISQIFGELIGAWLADCWQKLGSPKALLCEAGPGRGTLMKDILRATRNVQGFHDSIRIRLIETSPVLQALQKKTLHTSHPDIAWQHAFAGLPSLPLLFVANEFFDALPVHQHMANGSERMIQWKDNALVWAQEGTPVSESSPASVAIMKDIATHLKAHGGAALVIDYGYLSTFSSPNRREGDNYDTLQALRGHEYTDPLAQPGEADLTAHVDFSALMQAASPVPAHFTTQGEFLRRLGAELRATALCRNASQEQQTAILSGLERLVSPAQMGTLFKVLAVTSLENPAGF